MKKTFKYLVLTVAMLSMLCACGDKLKPTTVDAVTAKIKELGIYVEDNAYADSPVSGSQRIGGTTSNDWTYSFCDFGDDEESCDKMFKGYMDMVVEEVDSETNGSNYTIVEGEGGGDYVLVSRVDNTILVVWALDSTKSSKEEIRSLAEDLGYYK